ncbi:MAG: UvrB/UvrC motif-containing protein [Candidatus Taylorbacteria bacterium]|nr:UvrB/UvrC motif-containing protein [Candidatus Taylorbacteria bacterium]
MTAREFNLKRLPDSPGVYFFKKNKEILYIGKATSIRGRVGSYFGSDLIKTRGAMLVGMVSKADSLDFVKTDSVLEALIAEANLIKKFLPLYNVREKDDKSWNHLIITEEDFPRLLVVRGKDLEERFPKGEIRHVFGPYLQGEALRVGLKIIRRLFPYRDEKCQVRGRPCFNRRLGLCPGTCASEISKSAYAKILRNIVYFFQGKKGRLIKILEREMKAAAKRQDFEEAKRLRNAVFALKHLADVSVIKEEEFLPTLERGRLPEFRIEGYDVAHMAGKEAGGVMVVLEDNHLKKSDYRLFRIRGARPGDDVGALKEVMRRRLRHREWPLPHLLVVDGAEAQRRAAEEALLNAGISAPVVAVTKDARHRPARLTSGRFAERFSKEILLVNAEAHRFALKYHRRLRDKNFS